MYAYNPEGQMIAELGSSGNLKKYFIYGSINHVPDYFIDSNNNRFKIVVDQLGSVRLVVNANTGAIVEKMNHDEFGQFLADSNPSLTTDILDFADNFSGEVGGATTALYRLLYLECLELLQVKL